MGTESTAVDDISLPIELSTVDESTLIFYLAGKAPLAVTELAEVSNASEERTRAVLNERFQNELQIDQTGFIRLTEAARTPIMARAKQLISEASSAQKRAKPLVEDGSYHEAAEEYKSAVDRLTTAKQRLEAASTAPKKLDERIASLKETHDQVHREAMQNTLTRQKLLAKQREAEGDKASAKGQYPTAVESYLGAIDAYETARRAVELYNNAQLHDASSTLNMKPLNKLVAALREKLSSAQSQSSTADQTESHSSSTGEQTESKEDTDTPEATSTDSTSHQRHKYSTGGAKREEAQDNSAAEEADDAAVSASGTDRGTGHRSKKDELLASIESLNSELSQDPRLKTFTTKTSWSRSDITEVFGSWDDALEAAGIDKREVLIQELQRVAERVDGRPTVGDQTEHGRFSPTMFYDVFDSWGDAVEEAGVADSSPTPASGSTNGEATPKKDTDSTTQSTGSPDLSEFAPFDEIPTEQRFSGEVAIKVDEHLFAGSKRDASLQVSDRTGESVRFNFWAKHDLSVPQSVGDWYIVSEVRLQEWESDGETQRNLSSTRDTRWTPLNETTTVDNREHERPQSPENSARSSSEQRHTSQSKNQTKSNEQTSAKSDQESSTEDDFIESLNDELDELIENN